MKHLILLISILTISCNEYSAVNTAVVKPNSDTSTLYYKGKPLFIFGSSIDSLISKPDFFKDTINRQGNGYSYTTIDTFFSSKQSTGMIIGNLNIETNSNRKIQKVYGYWAISVEMNEKTEQEAISTIKQKYFPALSADFVKTKSDIIKHLSYIEQLSFYPSPDSGDIAHGFVPHWSFVYEAKHQ